MNLSKHLEFFDPLNNIKEKINIIGVGAIGSNLAVGLARLGVTKLEIWDMDTVNEHNITNQAYTFNDIGALKTDALEEHLKTINPDIKITKHNEGWQGEDLNGYIFLCVDDIDLRKTIVKTIAPNPYAKMFFDFRMRLTDAQHYAALNNRREVENLLKTMNFTKEEAVAATPVSACGTTLSVNPTVQIIVSMGIANFMNYLKTGAFMHLIMIDAFAPTVEAC